MNPRLDAVLQYLIARARETSTWRGLILVGTAFCGWSVPEDKIAAVSLVGLGAAGLLGLMFPDKTKPPQ